MSSLGVPKPEGGIVQPRQPPAVGERNKQGAKAVEPIEPSDEELMSRCRNGDEWALAQLIRRHGGPLLGYLHRMVGNRPQAEDLFQETFVRVYHKAGQFREDAKFKPWLYAIATHLALDELRRQKRRPLAPAPEPHDDGRSPWLERWPDPRPGPRDEAMQQDDRQHVLAALNRLSPFQRAIVNLAYFEGMTYSEAAHLLGRSLGTVKKQMSRALRRLAAALKDLRPEVRAQR